jgi:WD40 repeat protein
MTKPWGLALLLSTQLLLAGRPVGPARAPKWTLTGHQGNVRSVVWSPDGRQIASVADGDHTERVWDSRTGKQISVNSWSSSGWSLGLSWGPGGLLLASTSEKDSVIRIWDRQHRNPLRVLSSPRGHFTPWIAWAPDGQHLASWNTADHELQIWDIAGGSVRGLDLGGLDLAGAAWSPNGKQIAVVSGTGDLQVVDSTTGQCLKVLHRNPGFDFGHGLRPVAWSLDGQRLATSDYRTPEADEVVRVWDVATGRLQATLPRKQDALGQGAIVAIAWSPDGKRLAYSRDGKPGVAIWDLARSQAQRLSSDSLPVSLAWSPDGNRLAAGCNDGKLVIWSIRS